MLPNRDERLTTLERWVSDVVDSRTDPEERQLVHRYVVWHHIATTAAQTQRKTPTGPVDSRL